MKIVIAIPARNEELILKKTATEAINFCRENLADHEIVIAIVNNASTDDTGKIAEVLSLRYPEVKHIYIDGIGKGLAISTGWNRFEADAYCFFDADLATNLSALVEAVKEIESGADVVAGCRFDKRSKVDRGMFRKIVSNGFRLFSHILFRPKVRDLPCGFKMVTKKVWGQLSSEVADTGFFWDTELLILAGYHGFTIKEIPVTWSDSGDSERASSVNVITVSTNYIKKSLALKKRLLRG